jgi:hypothetical protein
MSGRGFSLFSLKKNRQKNGFTETERPLRY